MLYKRLLFFIFLGLAFLPTSVSAQSILYSQSLQNVYSGVISTGGDHVRQLINCNDINGIVEQIDMYVHNSLAINTDIRIDTQLDGVGVANSAYLTQGDNSLHIATWDLGDIWNGADNYGDCRETDVDWRVEFKMQSNNGSTVRTRGQNSDVYLPTDCTGTDCSSINDLYIVLRGTPEPVLFTGGGDFYDYNIPIPDLATYSRLASTTCVESTSASSTSATTSCDYFYSDVSGDVIEINNLGQNAFNIILLFLIMFWSAFILMKTLMKR